MRGEPICYTKNWCLAADEWTLKRSKFGIFVLNVKIIRSIKVSRTVIQLLNFNTWGRITEYKKKNLNFRTLKNQWTVIQLKKSSKESSKKILLICFKYGGRPLYLKKVKIASITVNQPIKSRTDFVYQFENQ